MPSGHAHKYLYGYAMSFINSLGYATYYGLYFSISGDRVHLHPAPACHVCELCVIGKEHNCQYIKLGKMFHGHIRRICNHPAEYTIR